MANKYNYVEFKKSVEDNLKKRRTSSADSIENLMLDSAVEHFIEYCYTNFDNYDPERCAVGIIAKLDSQRNPEKYKDHNMNSAFEVHMVAKYIMHAEQKKCMKELKE